MTSPDEKPWPTLRSWVRRERHPLAELLTAADSGPSYLRGICAWWDDLLYRVESSRPLRWEGKRRDFRAQNEFRETLNAYSELAMAAQLLRAGVAFEFGEPGTPRPDLVLRQQGLGIEIGSRSLNGLQDLQDDIEALIQTGIVREHIQIHLSTRPLAISKSVRDRIVQQIAQGTDVCEEVRPAGVGQPAIHVRITRHTSDGPPTVSTSIDNALLTHHLTDVESEIRSAVVKNSRKLRQAESIPTILVVEVGRTGLAWLRPVAMWEQRLPGLLGDGDPYVAIAVMSTALGDDHVRLAWATNPHFSQNEHIARAARLLDQLSTAPTV